MQFFVGIDVSLDSSSICVIDERGVIIKEGKTDSDPAAIARFIRHKGRKIEHVGLETGSLSQWLHAGLVREGFRVTVMEARHVRAAFAAMRVKTDRNDARGIAQLVRLGWFKAVHVKAPSAQETRALLNARRFLVDKLTGIENSMRASLRNFGLKMGQVLGLNLGDGLFDILQREIELFGVELLGASTKLQALQLSDQMAKAIILGGKLRLFGALGIAFGPGLGEHRAQRGDVVRQRLGGRVHGPIGPCNRFWATSASRPNRN